VSNARTPEADVGLVDERNASSIGRVNLVEERGVPNEAVPNVVQLETRADYRAASLNPSPNTVYQYNGYEFTTDSLGRPVNSSGQLSLGNGGNRFYDDYQIGYPHNADALPGDVGFHAGGDQFGFPGGQLNIFPGNGELNSASGAYGSFERDVLKPLVADPNNTVNAQFQRIFYEGNYTTRPNEIQVIYQVNDQAPVTSTFLNQPGG
ncbi:DNA/RNA non-specific endonuclease, partial [Dyella acidisoli]